MKIFWIIAIVIVVGLLLVGAAQNNKTQWEYAKYGEIYGKCSWETGQDKITKTEEEMRKFIECPRDNYSTTAFLNYAGKEGWELCDVVSSSEEPIAYYYFRRPK